MKIKLHETKKSIDKVKFFEYVKDTRKTKKQRRGKVKILGF